MKISEIGEFGLIKRISQGLITCGKNVVQGIGDDTAVMTLAGGRALLMTTDMLVEGIHFRLDWSSLAQVGWKSVAVNVSDIAAMGGTPAQATVAIAIPPHLSVEDIEQLYAGIKAAAGAYGVDVVGGDTVKCPERLVINITLLGEAPMDGVVYRHGAASGDVIMVTGTLGNAAAGLYLLEKGITEAKWDFLRQAHREPQAALQESSVMAAAGGITSMNDISDGLASEVLEICAASGTGCLLEADKIPVSAEAAELASVYGCDPLDWALYGGEDLQLVFTASQDKVGLLQQALDAVGAKASVIGKITEHGEKTKLFDKKGHLLPLEAKGYNHFADGYNIKG